MLHYNQRKRQFLQWVLERYRHEDPAVTYLLQFLMTQPDYIEHIVFSEQVKYAPRGIYISYQTNTAVPFVYFKDKLSYTRSEQAFHDIRLNQLFTKETFYIELNIPDFYAQLYARDLFTENPYAPVDETLVTSLDSALYQMSYQVELRHLNEQLNMALEERDFEAANQLAQRIEQLKGAEHED